MITLLVVWALGLIPATVILARLAYADRPKDIGPAEAPIIAVLIGLSVALVWPVALLVVLGYPAAWLLRRTVLRGIK